MAETAETTEASASAQTVTNPFENDDEQYLVLVNDEGQHALWPADLAVPPGWHTALTAASRQECLDYVETHWTDMRPVSVRDLA